MDTTGAHQFLLREADDDGEAAARALLAVAGWAAPLVDAWAAAGDVLELYDPADGLPCGAAIVGPVEHDTIALRAWAVDAQCVDGTAALRLVGAIVDLLRRRGTRRVVACVGDADADELATLVAAGFRFAGVERDAALATAARPCHASRDLIWMDQDL
jgi:hypothetical protein